MKLYNYLLYAEYSSLSHGGEWNTNFCLNFCYYFFGWGKKSRLKG